MLSPKLPKPPAQTNPTPSLVDPTVMFARIREKQKAAAAFGRESTILTGVGARPLATVLGSTQKLGGY